jgi:hypothetical protein
MEEGDISCLKEANLTVYKGMRCQECEINYFKDSLTNQCFRCGDRKTNILLTIAIFILGLLYFLIVIM